MGVARTIATRCKRALA
jgi:hypothetical protein